ncbi:MAG: hypothetical protein KA190_20455 [Kofleriaceae bacterium]|nr:hypothetical protein [Kofleriaceae bacterium]
MSVGHSSACAIGDDDQMYCWGANDRGQTATPGAPNPVRPSRVPGTAGPWAEVSAGGFRTCAIREPMTGRRELWCWGRDGGQRDSVDLGAHEVDSAKRDWQTVAVSSFGVCATDSSSVGYCWERESDQQPPAGRAYPGSVLPGTKRFAVGDFLTCRITSSDLVECEGQPAALEIDCNQMGDLCLGMHQVLSVPVRKIDVGRWHACALTTSDTIWCWGSTSDGSISGNTTQGRQLTQLPGSGYREIATGAFNTCVESGGQLSCFGVQDHGLLPDDEALGSRARAALARSPIATAAADVAQMDLGATSGCLIDHAGVLSCWGENGEGQLGRGELGRHTTPLEVYPATDAGGDWLDVALGETHTCATGVRTDGSPRVWCWGGNADLQLGVWEHATSGRPVVLPVSMPGLGQGYPYVSSRFRHTCLNGADGPVCWGWNAYNQIDQSPNQHRTPSIASVPASARVETSAWRTCSFDESLVGSARCSSGGQDLDECAGLAVRVLGSMYLGGITATGQLCGRAMGLSPFPPATYRAIDVGLTVHACGVPTDGQSYRCWGYLTRMDGLTEKSSESIPAPPGVVFEAIAAGNQTDCVVTDAGHVFCFGSNDYGEAGTRPGLAPYSPDRRINLPADVCATSDIAVGPRHSCVFATARNASGACPREPALPRRLFCWGSNSHGQLAHPYSSGSAVPLLVVDPAP